VVDRKEPVRVMRVETNAMHEAWLISQARDGDISSFSALVEIYQERAVRTAYSFLGNMEDARDSAQEAFVKAYDQLPRFNADSRFYTWFYRILINCCKDFLRKKKSRPTVSFWAREEEGMDLTETLPAKDKDAAQSLANKELGDEIYKALETLPFQQRSAFTLRYLDGLSLEEIAESMDLSVGAVKAHLWQAGQKMKKLLKLAHIAGGES